MTDTMWVTPRSRAISRAAFAWGEVSASSVASARHPAAFSQ